MPRILISHRPSLPQPRYSISRSEVMCIIWTLEYGVHSRLIVPQGMPVESRYASFPTLEFKTISYFLCRMWT